MEGSAGSPPDKEAVSFSPNRGEKRQVSPDFRKEFRPNLANAFIYTKFMD
jgi:hypothetical protein